MSFELAAQRLGADVVNLDMQSSSRVKGETVLDTIYTLQAMHADILVMRDAEPGLPAYVAQFVAPHVCILNAGEAHLSHPTQGLLDALTVRQTKGDFEDLRVLIAGDIAHSRVARSAWQAFTTLGVKELRIAAPDDLMPKARRIRRRDALHRHRRGDRGRRRRHGAAHPARAHERARRFLMKRPITAPSASRASACASAPSPTRSSCIRAR